MEATEDDGKTGKAYNVLVRLALPPYTIHFKSPTFMKESVMEMLDKTVCKESLKATAQKAQVRSVFSHYDWTVQDEHRLIQGQRGARHRLQILERDGDSFPCGNPQP